MSKSQRKKTPSIGSRTPVLGFTIAEEPYVEGIATIIEAIDEHRGVYRVMFEGETRTRVRMIPPHEFADGDALLRYLKLCYEFANSLHSVDDLFPPVLLEKE